MANFQQLFPTFPQKCAELRELLRIVAFMLFIVGTILLVLHGFTGKTLILHMVRLFMLTALLVMLPQWGNEAQRILQTSILDGLGVDPSQVHEQYTQLLAVRRDTGNDRSWWDILGDLNAFTVELLITGILWLVGQFASLLLFSAYIIQKFILQRLRSLTAAHRVHGTPAAAFHRQSLPDAHRGRVALAARLGRRRAHHAGDFGFHDRPFFPVH